MTEFATTSTTAQPVQPPPVQQAQGGAAAAANQDPEVLAPNLGEDVVDVNATPNELPVNDSSESLDPVSQFTKYLNDMIGRPQLGGEFKEWMTSLLFGSRMGTFILDQEFIDGLEKALGLPEGMINEDVVDQLFGNGDGELGDEVELTTLNDRLEFLTPQVQARRVMCNEGLANILTCDGIQWIDQAQGFSEVDIVELAKNGDRDMYESYLALAWRLYAEQADTPEEAMRRNLVAKAVEDGQINQDVPEAVKKILYYLYMAGLDHFLTTHDIEVSADADFTDPEVRHNYLAGLFTIFVENGDLPVNNEEFVALYADVVGDKEVVTAEDLAAIAGWRAANLPEREGIPVVAEGGAPAQEAETAEPIAQEEPAETTEEPSEIPEDTPADTTEEATA